MGDLLHISTCPWQSQLSVYNILSVVAVSGYSTLAPSNCYVAGMINRLINDEYTIILLSNLAVLCERTRPYLLCMQCVLLINHLSVHMMSGYSLDRTWPLFGATWCDVDLSIKFTSALYTNISIIINISLILEKYLILRNSNTSGLCSAVSCTDFPM